MSVDKYTITYGPDNKPSEYTPTTIREIENHNFNIPFDTWVTIEYYFQEGHSYFIAPNPAGHFYMTVQPSGGQKTIIFNERVATHHPNNPSPDGLTTWHPMKFYTSKEVANYMKLQNQPLEIYWDDLKIYRDCIPNDPALIAALNQ